MAITCSGLPSWLALPQPRVLSVCLLAPTFLWTLCLPASSYSEPAAQGSSGDSKVPRALQKRDQLLSLGMWVVAAFGGWDVPWVPLRLSC